MSERKGVITIDLGEAARREEEYDQRFREYVDAMDESVRLQTEMIEASHRAQARREKARLSHSSRGAVAIWWCSLATMAAILVIIALVKM